MQLTANWEARMKTSIQQQHARLTFTDRQVLPHWKACVLQYDACESG